MALILCLSHQALWYLQIYSKDALVLTARIYGNVKDGKMLEDRFMESYEDFDPMNGWMFCDFTSLSTISVISGRWADENKRLCTMIPSLWLRRFCLERDSNSGPLDQ